MRIRRIMRIRRTVFAGLGVLAFLVAVILTQMSADESRWSNFGISVGLSLGLAVFMWFITDGLRADIKMVLGNQDELADHVDELMETIGKRTEGTEVGRVDSIVDLLKKMTDQLITLGSETLGILDGVLTALGVQLNDTVVGTPKVRPGNRWTTATTSIKTAVQTGPINPNSTKSPGTVWDQTREIKYSLRTILRRVQALEKLEKEEPNKDSSLNAISKKQKTELHHSLDQLRESIEELKAQLKDEEAVINDDSAGDQLPNEDQT